MTGCPASARRSSASADRLSAAVLERDVDAAIRRAAQPRLRDAPRLDVASRPLAAGLAFVPRASGRRDVGASGNARIRSRPARRRSARRASRRAPARRSDRRGSRADRRRRAARRSRDRRSRSPARRGASAVDGNQREVRQPEPPSMSRITARSSPARLRRSRPRPRARVRTASQSTPFIVRSKCESRMIVQAASNVSTPSGTWAPSRRASATTSADAASRHRHVQTRARRRRHLRAP